MNASAVPTGREVVERAAQTAYDRPLITNVSRGHIVEAIVSFALDPGWRWCSGDYAAWDFVSDTGVKLEVRNAASRQSWHKPTDRPSRIVFDIAPREGRADDGMLIGARERWADLYVLAHHPVIDETADHRKSEQWQFYVIPARAFPAGQQKISLSRVQKLTSACRFEDLSAALAAVASR